LTPGRRPGHNEARSRDWPVRRPAARQEGFVTDAAGPPGGPLVLVADDEIEVRDLVCEVLAGAGFSTIGAGDGEEAVELARRHRPACIVLDLIMPRMDGYTALTRLRGHPVTAGVPVVVLTGQSDPVYENLSEGVGAVAHVTKPFSPGHLADTVRRALAEEAR
jgi:CheY-like chemotaxis protein